VLELALFKLKAYFALFAFLGLAGRTPEHDRKEIDKLVQQAQKGDKQAFEKLYMIFADNIYRYLRYMMSDEETAYDLTSQVFLKAYENLKSYRFKGYSFSAWLYRIAHNVAMDWFRSRKRIPDEVGIDQLVETVVDSKAPSFEEISIDRIAIESALKELTEKQRQVMILKYIEQMNNDEVGQILGKTSSAVKALSARALKELRKIILLQHAREQAAEKEATHAGRK
jgi:RNA polymerase sigma-70 factor (ECF subfamily)